LKILFARILASTKNGQILFDRILARRKVKILFARILASTKYGQILFARILASTKLDKSYFLEF
jgi:hypothetical protein